MATLNATKKAPILDQNGDQLGYGYAVTSSDPAIAQVVTAFDRYYLAGISAGSATVTATRSIDNAVATLDVEVVAAVPFTISLGAEVPA